MNSLSSANRRDLEMLFGMSTGYVLNFSDRTFGELVFESVGLDIHSERYTTEGDSKARKLRAFWKLESDSSVGRLLLDLVEHWESWDASSKPGTKELAVKCQEIATRLLARAPSLDPLKEHAKVLDAKHLTDQIRRIEAAIETDPSLAIGTAKELIETCCKTILAERGKPVSGAPDISALTKATMKELKLVPDDVPDSAKGADTIKRLLNNLGTIGISLAELRNLYGTGHGKHGKASGLSARHARLAVGSAATLAIFLFETHVHTKS